MKGPCCAICKVGSINCDGNGWNPFKNLLTCFWITSTASSTTAAPRYVSEWWKPSTATSKPFLEGAVVTRISAIYCSRPNAWRSPRPNSSFFRKPPKMRVSTNSCALKTMCSRAETPHPDAACGRFSEVHRLPVGTQRHRFIVLALQHFDSGGWPQAQPLEEFQKLRVLLVNANNLARFLRAQIGEQHRTLFSKLRDSPAHGHAMRATLLVFKSLEQQRFHFRRNRVFQPLRLVVSLRPGQPDYFRQQHLGELMPQRQVFGNLSAFLRQVDLPAALHAHMSVARHALQRGGHRGRSNFQFLGEPRADGRVVLFQHLPNRLQIIFLRYACLFSPQRHSYFSAVLCSRFSLRPAASWSTRRLMPSNTL